MRVSFLVCVGSVVRAHTQMTVQILMVAPLSTHTTTHSSFSIKSVDNIQIEIVASSDSYRAFE